jgi:hypothetical protein
MLERRMAYWDPQNDNSTQASVVRRVGNPQQVAVTEVNRAEFYNQANDSQPSRVDPRYGILHTEPAILRPDPMWAHRWPDTGPYRGATAAPFAWEQRQMDGFGEITTAQRDRYGALLERGARLTRTIRELQDAAGDPDRFTSLSSLEGQLERALADLIAADEEEGRTLSAAMDDVTLELDQVEAVLQVMDAGTPIVDDASFSWTTVGVGVGVVAALWWLMR